MILCIKITIRKIRQVFAISRIKCILPCVQKQHGITDCGLFAIAIATYLAFGNDPKTLEAHKCEQTNLRSHLIFSLEVRRSRDKWPGPIPHAVTTFLMIVLRRNINFYSLLY